MNEKYIPLYRKYRPKNLQEVVGQEHIKKALTNAITLNKISHAYLFTGPRGTGKTSSARILAKSLNCKEGPTITPCEVCPSCIDIKNSNPIDVIEIDAASNRKVEDAQNILEKIQYVAVNGKYKIYIIDEVHMLTNHAFNALLKTLEEPPENVIFILATTEPQKVLETITSRCQRFDFRRITTDDIVNHLKNIAKEEKINIEDDALFTIAKNSAGGMRDSLALLDQASVLDSAKKINTEDINNILGRLSFDVLNNLSQNIIESKPQEAIENLEKIYNSGNEPSQILINLLGYFKNLLITKNCEKKELLAELTQLNDSQIKALKSQSENIDTHQIIFLVEKIAFYIKEVKATTNQHLWLEISMIDLANLAQNTSLLDLQERITRLEGGAVHVKAPSYNVSTPMNPVKEKLQSQPVSQVKETIKPKVIEEIHITKPAPKELIPAETKQEAEDVIEPMPISKPKPEGQSSLATAWNEFLKNVSSPPTIALLSDHAKPIEISEDKIEIACEKEFSLKALSSDMKKKVISDAAERMFGKKDISVIVRLLRQNDHLESVVVEKKNTQIAEPTKAGVQTSESEPELDNEEELTTAIKDIKPIASDKNDNSIPPSDQVSMVMNLFNGKYID